MSKKISVLLLATTAMFAGCSEFNFNEEYARTETFDPLYVDGTVGVYAASAAVYGQITEMYTDIMGFMDCVTDNSTTNARSRESINIFNLGIYTENNLPDDIWDSSYGGIFYANRFLILTDELLLDEDLSESNAALVVGYRAEVTALKAFFYYELLKRYGPVPIIEQEDAEKYVAGNEDVINDISIPTLDEMVTRIAELCDEAAPDLKIYRETGTTYNRMIQNCTYMIKARTYLYAASLVTDDDTTYNSYLDKSIDASLELLSDRLTNITTITESTTTETDDEGNETEVTTYTETVTPVTILQSVSSLFNPSNALHYNNVAGEQIMSEGGYNHLTLAKAHYPVGFDLGEGNANPSHNLVEAFYKSQMKDMDAELLPLNTPVEYAEGTSPYDAFTSNATFLATVLYNGVTFNSRVLEMYEYGLDASSAFIPGTETGYYVTKFINPSKGSLPDASGTANNHWFFMRYAEVYFNLAEALFYRRGSFNGATEVGVSGGNTTTETAISYLNTLRTSATISEGVSTPTRGLPAIDDADFADNADFLAFLRNDRRIEFAFEGHRFFDVKRYVNMSSKWSFTPETTIERVFITREVSEAQTQVEVDITDDDGNVIDTTYENVTVETYTDTYTREVVEGEVRFSRMGDYPLPAIETLNGFL